MTELRKPSAFFRVFQILALALSSGISVPAFSQPYTIENFPVRPNLTKGGWALYSQTSGFQNKLSVMRVGEKEKVGKQKAQWLHEETLEPQLGIVKMDYLVEEGKSTLSGTLKSTLTFPGGTPSNLKDLTANISKKEPEQAEEEISESEFKAILQDFEAGLRCELIAPFQVGNRPVKTFRVQIPPDTQFLWSPEVPGFGIVQERGETTTTLIDFGVGDPPDLQQFDRALSGGAADPAPTPKAAATSSKQPPNASSASPLAAPQARTPLPILPAEKRAFDPPATCTAE